MTQSKLLIDTLKRYLSHKGITYRDLAKKVGQSESNIKRIFSQEAFSLKGLETMCEAAGIELFELARMSRPQREDEAACFSRAQELALAADPKLFAALYLLLAGLSARQIVAKYDYTKSECDRHLLMLDKLGLIRLDPGDRVHLLASKNIRWIRNGPLNELYEKDIKKEFMDSAFTRANERLRLLNGRLSKLSLQTLSRRIDRLVAEFVEFVEIDRGAAPDETDHIWFIVAYRPWRFSVVTKYRRPE